MSSSMILGLVGSLLILATLFEMMRRQRLREKYALFWSLIAVAASSPCSRASWPA